MSEPLRKMDQETESHHDSNGRQANLEMAAAHLRQAAGHELQPTEAAPHNPAPLRQLDYWWHADEHREVLLVVHYQLAATEQNVSVTEQSVPEILQVDVQQVDYRPPTDSERQTLQSQFYSELNEGGAVWDDLAATIWSRFRV